MEHSDTLFGLVISGYFKEPKFEKFQMYKSVGYVDI